MRLAAAAVVLASVLAGTPGRAEDPGVSPPAPAPEQVTTITGTAPDLRGRWLVVANLALQNGTSKTVASFWDVTRTDDRLVLRLPFRKLPPAQAALVEQANTEGKPWQPTSSDLAALAAGWDALPPMGNVQVSRVETEILGRDAFDEQLKADEAVKNAMWVLRQAEQYLPSAAPLVREAMAYGALEQTADGFAGHYDHLMLAAAPFPIPISLKGTFSIHRLEGPPAKGLLARLLDQLTGCGRR